MECMQEGNWSGERPEYTAGVCVLKQTQRINKVIGSRMKRNMICSCSERVMLYVNMLSGEAILQIQ